MSARLRFAALVTLHERQEQEARRRLGDLERHRQESVERIGALLHERHSAAAAVGLSGRDQLTRFWIHIEGQVRVLQEGLGKVDLEITTARNALVEVHRAHAIFRKLQDRDALERARQAERQAQRQLEEFAARRHGERQLHERSVAANTPHQEVRP